MASLLLKHLGEVAQRRGVTKFVAQVLRENDAMRALFSKFSPEVSSVTDSSWMTYRLDVDAVVRDLGEGTPASRGSQRPSG
jgi:hypothetical protein